MDLSSFVLLSHERALQRKLEIAANNLANMNSVGFKREKPLFHEYLQKGRNGVGAEVDETSYVLDYGATHDTAQGSFQVTGNPLDVMIDGPGYLSVDLGEGEVGFTRAGSLKVMETGEVTNSAGRPVLGEGGAPLFVPPDLIGQLSVAKDGAIMGPDGPIGRISVTVFEDEAALVQRGDGLMTGAGGRELAPEETRIQSGGLESSNVQAIVETTDMIEILRSYQASKRMADDISEMRKRALSRLGRVN